MPRTGWLATGALACGLALGTLLPAGWRLLLVVVVAAASAGLAMATARRARSAALAFGVATIALRLLAQSIGAAPGVPPPDTAVEGAWTAQVITLGSTTGGQQRAVLMVRARDPATAPADTAGPWRTYAWLPRYPPLLPGDRIAFVGPLEPVRRDGSEFAGYLDGIGAVLTARTRSVMLLGGGDGVLGLAESVRRMADESLARVVPEPMAGLASAILVGRRDRVSREVADAFTATGLSHVVAISGWNIALIGAVVGGLLRAAGSGRRARAIGVAVALGAFTLIAGGGASVVRAALMGGVALVAREAGRPGTAAAALGLAVWLLLLLDPAMATDIGFQLSVAATAGLLAWGNRLTDRLLGTRPGSARRWLAGSLGVSLAAQAATLPLVLFHFGRLSLVSPLANLVIAPIVAPAMLTGSLCLVAGLLVGAGAPTLVAAPFAVLGWAVVGAMVAVAGTFAALPYASVELPPAPAAIASGLVAMLVALVAWRARHPRASLAAPTVTAPPMAAGGVRSRRSRLVIAGMLGAATLVVGAGLLSRVVHREARLVVTALDVGQGDSILVEGPRGGRLLLDGGPDPDRLLTVLDRHVPPWDRRIDLVIVTHPHEDHVAGLAMLLGRYRVAGIAGNGMLGTSPGDIALRERLARMGMTTSRLAAGDRLSFDGIHASIRWPIADEVPARAPSDGRRVNHTSLVLDLRFGERRMLFTGDIEDDVDPLLLAAGIGDAGRRLDVLKVAHHGSRTATSAAWLDVLRPRVALVSAGTGNPYGHPAPPTLERLEAHGARVLRTDLDGDLEVSTDGRDLRIATSRGSGPTTTAHASPRPTRPPSAMPGTSPCDRSRAPERPAAIGPSRAGGPLAGGPGTGGGRPRRSEVPIVGDPILACYDRSDDRPLTLGSSRSAALAPSHGRDRGAFHRDRGRRVVPGRSRTSRGPPGRGRPGGDRGPAA